VSDIPPRVRPEDFDALTAAMERCEATALRVAETRKRLKLDESEEVAKLRARLADREARIRAARASLWGQGVSWATFAILDLRRSLPKRRAVRRRK